MANYTDDFESYSTGTSLPAGWTSRWDTPTQWAIVDNSGDQSLKITPNTNRCFASMDAIDSDADRDDVEVLVKFRTTSVASGAHAHVVARGSGNGTSETGYVCGIVDNDFRCGRYVSGTFTAIGSTVTKDISTSTWYWIRFRVNSTSLKGRLWADGGSEPGTWDIDTTDSNISGTGWAGCFDFFGGTGIYSEWTDIAIATNGDTASMSSGVSGTLAYTNANDTLSATGTTTVTGTLAKTNANDTLSATGTTTVTGTLAKTNANDTLSAAGTTTVVGTLAYTNANDTISASGAVGSDITGTVNYTNADDTLSAAGTTTVTGTVAYTNANDTLSGAGSPIIVGDLAYTNANDTLSASGVAGVVTGTLDYTNASDTLSASGQVEGSDAEIAGAGYPVYQVKQRKKQKPHVRIDDVIERSMRELYEGVIDTAPQQIKKQAAKLVRPYIEKGTKPATVPPPSAINWIALERDAARVSALLALWQEQMESLEDEEMLLMLMAA